MPKELIATAVRQPVLRDYGDGPVPEGHIRVKVEFGSPKRGTELTMYRGYRGASFPMGLGNICVGRVVEIGAGVEDFLIGDRVAGYGQLREREPSLWSSGTIKTGYAGSPSARMASSWPRHRMTGPLTSGGLTGPGKSSFCSIMPWS